MRVKCSYFTYTGEELGICVYGELSIKKLRKLPEKKQNKTKKRIRKEKEKNRPTLYNFDY